MMSALYGPLPERQRVTVSTYSYQRLPLVLGAG
jgi:hypothetical protein